jgi:uncharacterized protein YjbJ (UPF0337 family)
MEPGDKTMNKDVLKGKWRQLQGDIKTRWAKLTDDDFKQAEGNYDKLVGCIQEKYGYAKDKAEREIDEFLATHPEVTTPAGTTY